MAEITKRGAFDCDGEGEGERGERGKRGHRGPPGRDGQIFVDHVTIDGGNSPEDPAHVVGVPLLPEFPVPRVLHTIYANQSGNDANDGLTPATALRTFQEGVRRLFRLRNEIGSPLPNNFYRLDVTGLGPETLPPNYQLPAFLSTFGSELRTVMPDVGPAPFVSTQQVQIYAQPAVVDTFTSGTVFVEPTTGLVEIQNVVSTSGKNYVVNELQGKQFQYSYTLPDGETGTAVAGVIWRNTAGVNPTIFVTHAYVPDAPPPNNGFATLPQAPFAAVTQSAELIISRDQKAMIQGCYQVVNDTSIGHYGIKFTKADKGDIFGVQVWAGSVVVFEGCDMEGFADIFGASCTALVSTHVHEGPLIVQGGSVIYSSYLHKLPTVLLPMSSCGSAQGCTCMMGFVAEQCAPLGPRYNPFEPAQSRGICGCIDARYGVVFNAIPDQNMAITADPTNKWVPFPGAFWGVPVPTQPDNKIPGYGFYVKGGCLALDHIKIFGCESDGIHAEVCEGCALIKGITGGEGGTVFGGLPNAPNGQFGGGPVTDPNAVGLSLSNAAHFTVQDLVPAAAAGPVGTVAQPTPSSVTGVLGDLKVGNLPYGPNPAPTWAGPTGLHTVKRYFDINPGAVGPAGGAVGTGCILEEIP